MAAKSLGAVRADGVVRGLCRLHVRPRGALPAGRRLGRREALRRAAHAARLAGVPVRGQRHVDAASRRRRYHDAHSKVPDHLEREGHGIASKHDGQEQRQYCQHQHSRQQHGDAPQQGCKQNWYHHAQDDDSTGTHIN